MTRGPSHKKGRKVVSKRPAAEVGRRPDAEKGLGEVMAIVARLRGEQGCPWDREQTHVSLKPALLEETYELLEAIERGDVQELEEELEESSEEEGTESDEVRLPKSSIELS